MLLGRDQEQLALVRLLEDARAGRSGVLAVVGEAGIGKSALLGYAEEQAGGMNVLRARGVQSEAQIPFAGLFELLRPALAWIDRIPGPQADALESALALRPARDQDRFAVGAATLSLLAAYADEAPVAVLVDDAHWLDGSSADALLFAFRRLVAEPVAVILAVREGESSLLDGADLTRLRLPGLDRAAAAELLRRQPAGPLSHDLADRLHDETGGNPLALLELGADREPAGQTCRPARRSRSGRASPRSTCSASGRFPSARAMPSSSPPRATAARCRCSPAPPRRSASTSPTSCPPRPRPSSACSDARVEFRHPLARSAVYGDAPPDQRREVHRALAGALPDADADRRAWHLALAAFGPDEAASSALEQAGLRARQRSAYDVSSRAFERGARLAPDEVSQGRLLYAAADAAWLGGLADRAAALLDEARQRASATPDLAISIEHLRGHIAARRGPIGDAQQILLAAAEQAAPTEPGRAVVMLAEAVNASFYAGDAAAMRHAADRIAALTPADPDDRTAFFALSAQGMALIFSGEGERGAAAIRESVEVLERSDELRHDPRLLAWAAMAAPLAPRSAHRTGARRPGARRRPPQLRRRRAAVRADPRGHRPGRHRPVGRSASQLSRSDRPRPRDRSAHGTGDLAGAPRRGWKRGRAGPTRAACTPPRRSACPASSASACPRSGRSPRWAISSSAAATRRRPSATSRSSRPCSARVASATSTCRPRRNSSSSTSVSAGARTPPRPPRRYERDAAAKAQPWALARAARCRGLLAADDDADRHFTIALSLHDQTPDVFETARTRLAYGSRLRRARQRVRAREQLRAAIDVFDHLGADPWSEMARAELAATGETARRRDPVDPQPADTPGTADRHPGGRRA